jgi:hypothetical protein
MKKTFSILLLLSSIVSEVCANQAYVIRVGAGQSIPKEKQPLVYQCLTDTFPAVLNPQRRPQCLTSDQIDCLLTDERAFVTDGVFHALSDTGIAYKIIAVPKSMAQLLAYQVFLVDLTNAEDNDQLVQKVNRWRAAAFSNDCLKDGSTPQQSIFQACQQYTCSEKAQALFWLVNDHIARFFEGTETIDQVAITSATNTLVRTLTTQFKDFWNHKKLNTRGVGAIALSCDPEYSDFFTFFNGGYWSPITDRQNKRVIQVLTEHFIAEQLLATDICRMYSAAGQGSWDPVIASRQTLCASNGLFGGLGWDSRTGCAGSRIFIPCMRLIRMDIKKTADIYTNPDSPVWIPPLSWLAATFGRGEFHHPRGKIILTDDNSAWVSGVWRENSRNGAKQEVVADFTHMPELFLQNRQENVKAIHSLVLLANESSEKDACCLWRSGGLLS